MITTYRLAFTDSLMSAFRPRGAPARWNSKGVVIVYTSEHVALSALEILHGWETYPTLKGYHLFSSTFSEELIATAPQDVDLEDRDATRTYGDAWVESRNSLALRVASVVVPRSFNYLLNPNHPAFHDAVELQHLGPFAFDSRVEKLVEAAKRS